MSRGEVAALLAAAALHACLVWRANIRDVAVAGGALGGAVAVAVLWRAISRYREGRER